MKLDQSKWVNLFPRNPTQTKYLRFLKTPNAKMNTLFTDNEQEFKKNTLLPDRLKTVYSDLWEENT